MNAGERGFTLIELLVVIMLSGIVGAMATTVIVQGFHQQAASDARLAAVAHVRTALQRTMRELRQAELTSLTPNSLDMTEDTTKRSLSYKLVTSNGTTSLVLDDGATTSVVVSNVVNDAGQPVFTPLPLPGYVPAIAGTVDPSTCAEVGVTPTQYSTRDCVGTVTVDLRVMPTDAAGHPLCAPSGGCVVDVSDDADIRNNS